MAGRIEKKERRLSEKHGKLNYRENRLNDLECDLHDYENNLQKREERLYKREDELYRYGKRPLYTMKNASDPKTSQSSDPKSKIVDSSVESSKDASNVIN